MKIAVAQTNPIIGAFDYNLEKISHFIEKAKEKGADLIIFPELTLMGYPPKDLLERDAFINHSLEALENLVRETKGIGVICGCVEPHQNHAKPLFNTAVFFKDGQILVRAHKMLLPSYHVLMKPGTLRLAKSQLPLNGKDLNGALLSVRTSGMTRTFFHANNMP